LLSWTPSCALAVATASGAASLERSLCQRTFRP
jgi:hypothetical protein